jgi:hypothetical protein
MAHFDDISEYRYSSQVQPGVVHVGWLSKGHLFTQGPVNSALIAKMRRLAETPEALYRGFHLCEFCDMPAELRERPYAEQWEKWEQFRASNGEIRVSRDGITYAAPLLITHYIEAHGYCPPVEFLRAIEEAPIRHRPQPTHSITHLFKSAFVRVILRIKSLCR